MGDAKNRQELSMIDAIEMALRTPCHEAGHAVVAHALGCEVTRITPGEENAEAITFSAGRKGASIRWFDVDEIGRDIAITFGGYVAERRSILAHRAVALAGAEDDFKSVESWNPFTSPEPGAVYLRELAGNADGWRSFVRAWYRVAVEIVRLNWEPLSALRDELLFAADADTTLEGALLRKLLRRVKPYHLGRPRWRWPDGLHARWLTEGRGR
jgi:hypothetical protein